MTTFEKEFTKYIANNYPCAEVVAGCLNGSPGFQNADYFFNNRNIIMELKCLEEERYFVLHETFQRLLDKKEIPLFQKGMTVGEVLKGHPKEAVIKDDILNRISASLEGALEKANRQIRETKKNFNLTDAEGVALLINIDNTILEPQIAVQQIHRLILKKGIDREYRYEELSMIIYVSHVHYQAEPGGRAMMPFFVTIRKDDLSELEKTFLEEFKNKWSEFMGLPVNTIEGAVSGDIIKKMPFLSKKKGLHLLLKKS
jgi:hypothetical protein